MDAVKEDGAKRQPTMRLASRMAAAAQIVEKPLCMSPERQEGESFEQYKARRSALNAYLKNLARPKIVHVSSKAAVDFESREVKGHGVGYVPSQGRVNLPELEQRKMRENDKRMLEALRKASRIDQERSDREQHAAELARLEQAKADKQSSTEEK